MHVNYTYLQTATLDIERSEIMPGGFRRLINGMILVYFLMLLLFGRHFTKWSIIGPLYVHDLYLAVLTVISLISVRKFYLRYPALLILLAISITYLFVSLFYFRRDSGMMIIAFRQFAIFLYFLFSYLIAVSRLRDFTDVRSAIELIRIVSILAVIAQVVFLLYSYFFIDGFSVFRSTDYAYLSPLVIMGIISFAAFVLSRESLLIWKILLYAGTLALSITLGHSSAFLAVLVILLLYLSIRVKPYQRVFSIVILLLMGASLFLLPQFTDNNASWRLLFWKHVLTRSWQDGHFVFGHGFGQPYMTRPYAEYLYAVMGSTNMLEEIYPMARYINPPHNSLLTIVFHVGLIPFFLLLWPLKSFFRDIFLRRQPADPDRLFLILALTGSLVWICFNVILELPHSSVYFWLIYFTTLFYYRFSAQPHEG